MPGTLVGRRNLESGDLNDVVVSAGFPLIVTGCGWRGSNRSCGVVVGVLPTGRCWRFQHCGGDRREPYYLAFGDRGEDDMGGAGRTSDSLAPRCGKSTGLQRTFHLWRKSLAQSSNECGTHRSNVDVTDGFGVERSGGADKDVGGTHDPRLRGTCARY